MKGWIKKFFKEMWDIIGKLAAVYIISFVVGAGFFWGADFVLKLSSILELNHVVITTIAK